MASKYPILFNREKASDVEVNIHDENVWDDTMLIKAYDESLMLVKEEVAKKLAKATNKSQNKKDGKKSPKQRKSSISENYKIGDYVRATFTDGLDYEAKILNILEDKTCLLRYVGYGNEEYVAMNDLVPSWGESNRLEQKEKATEVPNNTDCTSTSEIEEESHRVQKNLSTKRKNNNKRIRNNHSPVYNQMNEHSSIMFPPPPPMPPMIEESEDAEHLSAMLMSWYMSGYYTGLYQGQRSVKRN